MPIGGRAAGPLQGVVRRLCENLRSQSSGLNTGSSDQRGLVNLNQNLLE
jgi:hypothetical protein